MTDDYMSKGHLWTKIRITLLTIVAWIAVVVPIYWTVSSTLLSEFAFVHHVWHYQEGKAIYYHAGLLLLIFTVGIVIAAVLLTFRNNQKIKRHVHKEIQYDPYKLQQREAALQSFYHNRFDDEDFRHHVRFYSVPEQKNLETDTIQDVFKKAGVEND